MTEIGIAVVEREGQYLVGHRAPGQPLAGMAEFPGGKCEPGEAAVDCAVRECREETGLDVRVIRHFASASGPGNELRLHFWLCELTGSESNPREPFRWVERRALGDLPFPGPNAEVITALTGNSRS